MLQDNDKSGRVKKADGAPHQSREFTNAFLNGREQIIHAFDGRKHKFRRTNSAKRREALKKTIRLVGPSPDMYYI